jgi:anti-sigma B factor antagonist
MVEINISHLESVVLVEVSGRIDSMNANEMGSALSGELDAGHIYMVLDLNQVEYMSSAGLRELVNALKKSKRASGDVRIAQPSDRVREVLEMAGLDTIFRIFPNQTEAIESY